MTHPLRLGTRRSALATTQAGWVADLLRARGQEVDLVEITTDGDRDRVTPLRELGDRVGGTGVFVSALRDALRSGAVDLAVHSLKDLPTAPEADLVVAAIPTREDPRDALVARDGVTLGELPAGAVVGTGSPRRQAQLAALGLGLDLRELRGNVDTRLRSVAEGRYDAIVLACAGLRRLGRADEITEALDPIQLLPAPGQGALAVEVRAGDRPEDRAVRDAVAPLDDPDTRACVTAERALLAALEAGCSAPVGALAEVVESLVTGPDGGVVEALELSLRAFVGSVDGSVDLRRSLVGHPDEAEHLGHRLAAILLEDGAAELTGAASSAAPTSSPAQSSTPIVTERAQ